MNLADELDAVLPRGSHREMGQLWLSRTLDGIFEARHRDDARADEDSLETLDTARAVREVAKYDAAGEYRPLKTAPTLRRAWRTATPSASEFLARLDAIYPGAFATRIAWSRDQCLPVPLRTTLQRQTGMYRLAGTISDEDARRIRHELCAPGCLRHILWPISGEDEDFEMPTPPGGGTESIPLLCTEACTFAVSLARELAKAARERQRR